MRKHVNPQIINLFTKNQEMMSKPQTEQKSLIKNRGFLKGLIIGASILWVFILVAAIYFHSKTGNFTLFVPVFYLIVVFFPIYQRLQKLNAEAKSRSQDEPI
jgi:hypothetical protein